MKSTIHILLIIASLQLTAQNNIVPAREELITPIHKATFSNMDTCKERKQGGQFIPNKQYLLFTGASDGGRQVDPQIAVGGGYVLHGTNSGLVIYDTKGNYIRGISQKCFNDGIDPKMFFDIHNRVFVFDLWWYYDKAKLKPVNISVSETDNPNSAWNIYPISLLEAVDGGGIGYSKKWIGYSFPGGENRTIVIKTADAKLGKPTLAYHFAGYLGHPVIGQDNIDDLYFFEIDKTNIIIRKITEDANGKPQVSVVSNTVHQLAHNDWPPQSAQKGTAQKISSGDRNPKLVTLQNGSIWFSHAIKYEGKSAAQWHQINASNGNIIQSGIISHPTSNYIQTTLAVNAAEDLLVGFQQADSTMFVSARFAYRKGNDKPNKIGEVKHIGTGLGAADGVAWGDYSGACIDGDNLSNLWTIQSVATEKGKGATVIAMVKMKKRKKKK